MIEISLESKIGFREDLIWQITETRKIRENQISRIVIQANEAFRKFAKNSRNREI